VGQTETLLADRTMSALPPIPEVVAACQPLAGLAFQSTAKIGRALHNPGPIRPACAFRRGGDDAVDHDAVERAMDH
jgi:hypothetical protein